MTSVLENSVFNGFPVQDMWDNVRVFFKQVELQYSTEEGKRNIHTSMHTYSRHQGKP
jgi:hypothetical protein